MGYYGIQWEKMEINDLFREKLRGILSVMVTLGLSCSAMSSAEADTSAAGVGVVIKRTCT